MLVVAFVLANLWDSLSTYAALHLGAVEANPILRGLMGLTSAPLVLTLKVLVAFPLSIIVVKWKPRALIVLTLVLALVALSNLAITWAVLLP